MKTILPWQQNIWQQLLGQLDRLPHALLLLGPPGGGKTEFAHRFAARLLCEKARGAEEACGLCLPCGWLAAGNHPDFRLVQPEAADSADEGEEGGDAGGEASSKSTTKSGVTKRKSEQIRIDQIRALADFLAIGTHRQGARIVLIQPAEAMNQATANSLLKVLEEPVSSTLFLLVSGNHRRLLATIRSRCQAVDFPKPERAVALPWLRANLPAKSAQAEDLLAHVGGMPLAAVAEAGMAERMEQFFADVLAIPRQGPVAIAAKWEPWLKEGKDGGADIDKQLLTNWLQKWIYDVVSIKVAGRAIYHERHLEDLKATAATATASGLIDCYNELLRIKAVAQHPLNARLFLEDLLARYSRAVTKK